MTAYEEKQLREFHRIMDNLISEETTRRETKINWLIETIDDPAFLKNEIINISLSIRESNIQIEAYKLSKKRHTEKFGRLKK